MNVIINYGMGNLGSIKNMLKKIGHDSVISSDPEVIEQARKLILPGVGAFDNGMTNLKNYGIIDVLNDSVLKRKTPVLGICLGMQLISKSSEEGTLPGLGWIDAKTVRFQLTELKVPHMGWNVVNIKKEYPLFTGMTGQENRFYFVHSYHVVCENPEDVLTSTYYGIEFTSAIQHDNIYATQYHPEKSHKFGMRLLKNFMELV